MINLKIIIGQWIVSDFEFITKDEENEQKVELIVLVGEWSGRDLQGYLKLLKNYHYY
jgi:hypothetical protein